LCLCRTEGEFGGAGHPAGAVNIPYMHSTGSGKPTCYFSETFVLIMHKKEMLASATLVNCRSPVQKVLLVEWFQHLICTIIWSSLAWEYLNLNLSTKAMLLCTYILIN
jgi:hypothetical protein